MYTFNSFVVYSINLNNQLLYFKTLCLNQTLSSSIAATQLLFTLTTWSVWNAGSSLFLHQGIICQMSAIHAKRGIANKELTQINHKYTPGQGHNKTCWSWYTVKQLKMNKIIAGFGHKITILWPTSVAIFPKQIANLTAEFNGCLLTLLGRQSFWNIRQYRHGWQFSTCRT